MNENYADIAPRDLKNAIVEAGGVPIILPYLESPEMVAEMVQSLIGRIDGLIIPGGPDVSPHFYGEEPTVEIGSTNYLKDSFEIELIKAAVSEKKFLYLGFVEDFKSLTWPLVGHYIKI